MEVKEYTLITEHDIRGIGTATIIGKANGGDESYTVSLNEAQAKKILSQGAQLFEGGKQITLSDFAEEVEPQAINDGKCVDDYTGGMKNKVNSKCKVFASTRFFEPKTVEVKAAEEDVKEPEHTAPTDPGQTTNAAGDENSEVTE